MLPPNVLLYYCVLYYYYHHHVRCYCRSTTKNVESRINQCWSARKCAIWVGFNDYHHSHRFYFIIITLYSNVFCLCVSACVVFQCYSSCWSVWAPATSINEHICASSSVPIRQSILPFYSIGQMSLCHNFVLARSQTTDSYMYISTMEESLRLIYAQRNKLI